MPEELVFACYDVEPMKNLGGIKAGGASLVFTPTAREMFGNHLGQAGVNTDPNLCRQLAMSWRLCHRRILQFVACQPVTVISQFEEIAWCPCTFCYFSFIVRSYFDIVTLEGGMFRFLLVSQAFVVVSLYKYHPFNWQYLILHNLAQNSYWPLFFGEP